MRSTRVFHTVFKNLTLYRIGADWPATTAEWEQTLAQETFAGCGATQQKAVGWVPPRGQAHGALVEAIGGQWIARFVIETKAVPADALRARTDEVAEQIEKTTGRKPGKKERRDIRDDVLLELLPQAFPHRAELTVWVDPARHLLALDTSTQGKADDAVNAIVRVAAHGLTIAPLPTKVSPQAAMASWLSGATQVAPEGFDIGRDCELKGSGDEPAVIKFTRHDVLTDEVERHIAEGNLPTRLALLWRGRVRFALTHTLQLRQITFEEGVLDDDASLEAADRFDADVAITTGELGALVDDLITALGGAAETPQLANAATTSAPQAA